MSTPEYQALDKEWSPKLSAAFDKINLNGALFDRIAKVYEHREHTGLDAKQMRLVYSDQPGERVRIEETPAGLRNRFSISDADVHELAKQALVTSTAAKAYSAYNAALNLPE